MHPKLEDKEKKLANIAKWGRNLKMTSAAKFGGWWWIWMDLLHPISIYKESKYINIFICKCYIWNILKVDFHGTHHQKHFLLGFFWFGPRFRMAMNRIIMRYITCLWDPYMKIENIEVGSTSTNNESRVAPHMKTKHLDVGPFDG